MKQSGFHLFPNTHSSMWVHFESHTFYICLRILIFTDWWICFFSKFKSGQNWVVFFDFNDECGTLWFNVAIESVKKMSGIIFRENIYFVYLSHFLYISYGARFLFEIFQIIKICKYLWTFYIAYSLTTFITLLLMHIWPDLSQ